MYYDYNDKEELGLKSDEKSGLDREHYNRDNATHSHIYQKFKTISPKTLRKNVKTYPINYKYKK